VNRTPTNAKRRGFSVVELLVALSITSILLAGTLQALQTSFNSYKVTTESASTHVVARMIMHRLTAMVRQGTEFAPYPLNPIRNPELEPDPPFIEFTSAVNPASGAKEITRIERRDAPSEFVSAGGAPYELWFVRSFVAADGSEIGSPVEYPLLTDVQNIRFVLRYDVGPRLERLTIDLTVRPQTLESVAIAAGVDTPSFRFVTTVVPRRLDE
jgi:prepilin-type N-terminal cleavage/methylation domain-containing protein